MKNKYINIDERLLEQGFSLIQAALISYLRRFQLQGKYCYQSKNQIASFFNISESTLKREIKQLETMKVLFISTDKKYIPITFNNKKALVLNNVYVGNNNDDKKTNQVSNHKLDNSKKNRFTTTLKELLDLPDEL